VDNLVHQRGRAIIEQVSVIDHEHQATVRAGPGRDGLARLAEQPEQACP
jgi:hypothetical protein